MRTIEEVATEAAQAIVFENPETLVMLDITIAPKELPEGSKPYYMQIPKAFLEELLRLRYEEGYDQGMHDAVRDN